MIQASAKRRFVDIYLVNFVALLGAKKGSWKNKKYVAAIVACIAIPWKRINRFRRSPSIVEDQYDRVAGSYIQDNFYRDRIRFAVVDGAVAKISSIENMKKIRSEIRTILSDLEFETVLEVGVGELTTIGDIYAGFGPDIACYGIDLSLNRLLHGLKEFEKRHESRPIVAKANALKLPFPDDAFDLVITRHTLEQMPGIFEEAIDEIVRVSRRHIVLLEPSFELGSVAQKLKMLDRDYVRGIPRFLSRRRDITSKPAYLMQNSANPLNHTACYRLEKKSSVGHESHQDVVAFVCPKTKTPLRHCGDHYRNANGDRAYPIIDGVPILDVDHSFLVNA